MTQLPGSFFVVERGRRPNHRPARRDRGANSACRCSPRGSREFAARHRLPREDRDVLRRCEVTARYPDGG